MLKIHEEWQTWDLNPGLFSLQSLAYNPYAVLPTQETEWDNKCKVFSTWWALNKHAFSQVPRYRTVMLHSHEDEQLLLPY